MFPLSGGFGLLVDRSAVVNVMAWFSTTEAKVLIEPAIAFGFRQFAIGTQVFGER